MIGRSLGHYRIDALLGRGGHGEVYRARDTRLERHVALKRLTNPDTGDSQRLLHEARSASALNHPGICTVYEVGEAEGVPYIAMEYVEGQPLSDVIHADGLPPADVIRYGHRIADALAHAHDRGIVHRDLKGTNVLVTPDGRLKLVDFGIARTDAARLETVTAAGAFDDAGISGTLPYMSPETLRGEPAQAATDVWALGVVLYQMATGRVPFDAPTPFELSSRILRDPPPALPSRVPAALGAVIMRCLEKEPTRRYRSGGEIAAALTAITDTGRTGGGAGERRSTRAIAVLPFQNLMGNDEDAHLGVGLADATITELSAVRSLVVRPTSAILRYRDGSTNPLDAGRELHVDAVISAAFQRAGSRLRVTVQLIDTANGASLWGTRVTTSLDDLFELQDDVARQIARALEVEVTRADEDRLASAAQPATGAFEHFLKGRVLLLDQTEAGARAAFAAFERAAETDPTFARAYAGMADACYRMAFTFEPDGNWYSRARELTDRALSLDSNLPEGRYLNARLLWSPPGGFDHAAALVELLSAISASPGLSTAHNALAVVLFHVTLFDESTRAFERSLLINPDDGFALTHLATCWYFKGEFRKALDLALATLPRFPSYWGCYQVALSYLRLGQLDDAQRASEEAITRFPGGVLEYPLKGLLAAMRGRRDEADAQIAQAVRHRKAYGHYHHVQHDVACIHALLGRREEALRWLRDAADDGFPCYTFFEADALLASIHDDPAFRQLMNRLRDDCSRYRAVFERHARTTQQ